MGFHAELVSALTNETGLPKEEVTKTLTVPPNPDHGDYTFPCFALAKLQRKPPAEIASDLATRLAPQLPSFSSVSAAGPYVNFRVRPALFAEAVLDDATRRDFGHSTRGAGRTVVIDYSSPNIAKPFHVGHLRSTIIGASLYRLLQTQGFDVVGINHVGDWGTQFGKLITALKRWGREGDERDLAALNRLYVKYHAAADAEDDESLAGEARAWFRKQEAGDAEATRLWRAIATTSSAYFGRMYDRLGVSFDVTQGESFFNDRMDAVVEAAIEAGVATLSDGAWIVDLRARGIETPALLRKADGTTLYLTRDLAAAIYRYEEYGFDELLYVVGSEQTLHFQQLVAVLDALGYAWASRCVHVPFGRVEGMSTRAGSAIALEELLDEGARRALEHMREHVRQRPDDVDEDVVAEVVGPVESAQLGSPTARRACRDITVV